MKCELLLEGYAQELNYSEMFNISHVLHFKHSLIVFNYEAKFKVPSPYPY